MKKSVAIICFVLFGRLAHADEPLPAPKEWRACNTAATYCAQLRPGEDTIVFRIDRKASTRTEIYRIPGWHRVAFISEGGKFFAVGYPGGNLLDLDANEATVILTIWKEGQKHVEVKLGQVLRFMHSLRRTVSHREWGENRAFTKSGMFEIETVENRRVLVNPETGEVRVDKKNGSKE